MAANRSPSSLLLMVSYWLQRHYVDDGAKRWDGEETAEAAQRPGGIDDDDDRGSATRRRQKERKSPRRVKRRLHLDESNKGRRKQRILN
uniref:BZIP domain-containing protein n=1 Tax=Caenorhabditis tropicalis TaxID=1561998 RepID=A0A1I7T8B9_9PELO